MKYIYLANYKEHKINEIVELDETEVRTILLQNRKIISSDITKKIKTNKPKRGKKNESFSIDGI